jgi:hypothetical protein
MSEEFEHSESKQLIVFDYEFDIHLCCHLHRCPQSDDSSILLNPSIDCYRFQSGRFPLLVDDLPIDLSTLTNLKSSIDRFPDWDGGIAIAKIDVKSLAAALWYCKTSFDPIVTWVPLSCSEYRFAQEIKAKVPYKVLHERRSFTISRRPEDDTQMQSVLLHSCPELVV